MTLQSHDGALRIGDRERLVEFAQFPWFRHATIGQLSNVTLPSPHHLYWPDLDIDLAVDSLDHPERHPLVSRVSPERPATQTRRRVRRRKTSDTSGTAGREAVQRRTGHEAAMQIRPIKTPTDHRAALEQIERPMDARPGTPAGDRLDILTTLVEQYEIDVPTSRLQPLREIG